MIKHSKYNLIFEKDDNKYILYNTYTKDGMILNEFSKLVYDNIQYFDENNEFVKKFKEYKFIVDYDEYEKIKEKMIEEINNNEMLNVIICTTMYCNLACPYCFETKDKENHSMPEDIQKKIIAFLKKILIEKNIKKLLITWYGGEPLLYPDVIENMSNEFINFCDKNGVEYNSAIISNGVFFNQKNVDILEKAKVDFIQITLDGPKKEINDMTRVSKDGSSSFEKIIDNLYNIKTKMKIRVLFIVNKKNHIYYDDMKKLVDDIKNKTNNNLYLLASSMEKNDTNRKNVEKELYVDYDDRVKIFKNYGTEKQKVGKFLLCPASNKYMMVFDNKGNMYKCVEVLGKKDQIIKNINELQVPSIENTTIGEIKQMIEPYWLHPDTECKECIYLPQCSMLCPYSNVKVKGCKERMEKITKNNLFIV